MYTLDTNAILYYLSGENAVCELIEEAITNASALYVSAITVAELLRFPDLSNEEERSIRTFLSLCFVIPVDMTAADHAATIGRLYKVKLADSIIAVTAISTTSSLLTRNVRDFKNIQGLVIVAI